MPQKRFVLICPEPIQRLQQGIGIRIREMAAELGTLGEVSVWAPDVSEGSAFPFEVRRFPETDFVEALAGTDVVVVSGGISERYFTALDRHAFGASPPLVVDLYDPFLVEHLAYTDSLGDEVYTRDRRVLLRQLERGDFFLASSQAQRLFYLGIMIGQGSFRTQFYRDDSSLRSVIDVAPFGVRPAVAAPPAGAPGFKGCVKGIEHGDFVLFFGGVYDWYDPELILDILGALVEIEPRLRVVFSRNPNPETTPARMLARVEERAKREGWSERHVFFVPWFSYAERVRFLEDVDLAISLYLPSFETDLSLRTRVLEYLNNGIPVISTSGGETDAILSASGGGLLVPAGNPEKVQAALQALLGDATRRATMGEAGRRWVTANMSWRDTLTPLLRFCESPRRLEHDLRPNARTPHLSPLRYWRTFGSRALLRAAARRLRQK